MILVGATLLPIVIAIVLVLKLKILKKSSKILLELFITLTSILYMILSIVTKTEPFDFNIKEPGDYIIKAAVIFVFSPCLWAVLYYYCSKLFKNIKVAKNAKELALWENYLIYAVALDVNTKIEDEIIEKYINI